MLPFTGHIDPIWTLDELNALDVETAPIRSSKTPAQPFIDAGHDLNRMMIRIYFEPNPMPAFVDKIKEQFSHLNNLSFAVNCIPAGNYLPWHEDGYDRYRNLRGLSTSDTIYRAIIMAEDGVPGQYLHVNDQIYHNWKAGDWFAWYGATMHATYNLSMQDRYAFQLTGTI